MNKAQETQKEKCARCGSTNIECHCGLLVDRLICKDCGYEWH